MAKATEKPTARKAAPKKAKEKVETPKKAAPAKKTSGTDIVKAAETSLSKLRELNLDEQLQADLEWCLGSYKHDQNPVGLYEMVGRAVRAFTFAKETKVKGVTTKFISDLEKSLPAS